MLDMESETEKGGAPGRVPRVSLVIILEEIERGCIFKYVFDKLNEAGY